MMKELIKRAYAEQASKLATPATAAAPAKEPAPARKWGDRDFPVPSRQRQTPKAEERTSIHHRIISRTGK